MGRLVLQVFFYTSSFIDVEEILLRQKSFHDVSFRNTLYSFATGADSQ